MSGARTRLHVAAALALLVLASLALVPFAGAATGDAVGSTAAPASGGPDQNGAGSESAGGASAARTASAATSTSAAGAARTASATTSTSAGTSTSATSAAGAASATAAAADCANESVDCDRVSGEVEWRASGSGDAVRSSPTVADGTAYVGTLGGTVRAVDAHSGRVEWNASVGSAVSGAPTVVDGTVVVGGLDGRLTAIDADTGTVQWRTLLGGPILASPAIGPGATRDDYEPETIYATTTDGTVYAVGSKHGSEQWHHRVADRIASSPVAANGTVYVGSSDGTLFALDGSVGNALWTASTPGRIGGSPTVAFGGTGPEATDRQVLVGSDDGSLSAFDAATGRSRWTADVGGAVDAAPTVVDGAVYAGTASGALASFDVATGQRRWTRSLATGASVAPTGAATVANASVPVASAPTVANGTVYVGTPSGELYGVDAATGATQTSAGLDEAVASSPTVAYGRAFVGTDAGTLYAVDASARARSEGSRVALGTLGHVGERGWPSLRTEVVAETVRRPDVVAPGEQFAVDVRFQNRADSVRRANLTVGEYGPCPRWNASLVLASGESTTATVDCTLPDDYEDERLDLSVEFDRGHRDHEVHVPVLSSASRVEWVASTGIDETSAQTVVDGTAYAAGWTDQGHVLAAVDVDAGDERWRTSLDGEAIGSPAVSDGTVYLTESTDSDAWVDQGAQTYVTAVDAATGEVLWRRPFARDTHDPARLADGSLLLRTEGALHVLDPTTGAVRWTRESEDLSEAAVTASAGTVYVGTLDGTVSARDVANGSVQWRTDVGARYDFDFVRVVDGTTFVRSDDGNVSALDADTGAIRWSVDVGFVTSRGPIGVANGSVYLGHDGNVSAFDADTGERRWRTKLGDWIESDPTLEDGRLLVTVEQPRWDPYGVNYDVAALDPATGERAWSVQSSDHRTPIVADGTLLADPGGQLRAVDAGSGEERWTLDLPNEFGPPTLENGTVYVRTEYGDLYAIDAGFSGDHPGGAEPFEAGGQVDERDAVEAPSGVVVESISAPDVVAPGRAYRVNATLRNEGSAPVADRLAAHSERGSCAPSTERVALDPGATDRVVVECRVPVYEAGQTERLSVAVTGDAARTAVPVRSARGRIEWTEQLAYSAETSPTVVDGSVFVGSAPGSEFGSGLHALDAEDGDARWNASTDEHVESGPVVVDGRAYAVSYDGTVYATDAATGEVTWSASIAAEHGGTGPVVADGTVYLTTRREHSSGATVHALGGRDGRRRWNATFDDASHLTLEAGAAGAYVGLENGTVLALDDDSGRRRWSATVNASQVGALEADGDGLYVGHVQSALARLSTGTGTVQWQRSTPFDSAADLSLVDGRLYGAGYRSVWAVDPATGGVAWNGSVGDLAYPSRAPTVAGGSAYVSTSEGQVYSFDASTGERQWSVDTAGEVRGPPTVAEGRVYVGSKDGNLYALDAGTGSAAWVASTASEIRTVPTVAGGTVYATTFDGRVYAIDAGPTARSEDPHARDALGGHVGDLGVDSSAAGLRVASVESPSETRPGGRYRVEVTLANPSGSSARAGTLSVRASAGSCRPANVSVTVQSRQTRTVEVSCSVPGDATWPVHGVVASTEVDLSWTRTRVWPEAGTVAWRGTTDAGVRSSPTIVDGTVYAGSGDGALRATDARTGERVWRREASGPIRGAPTVADGTVFAGSTTGTLYAVDGRTGERRWSRSIGDRIEGAPAVANGTAYVVTGDGTLRAFDASTGDPRWNATTGTAVRWSPTVANGTVYLGASPDYDSGTVHAIDARTGETRWTAATSAGIEGPATVAGRGVFVGLGDGVVALNRTTGEQRWRLDSEYSAATAPTVANGTVYVAGAGAALTAIDASTGLRTWSARGPSLETPTVAGERVYAATYDGTLYALDRSSGQWVWSAAVGAEAESAPTVAGGLLYGGTSDGGLYAVRTGPAWVSNGSRVRLGTLGHVGDRARPRDGFAGDGPRVELQTTSRCLVAGTPTRFEAEVAGDPAVGSGSSDRSYQWSVDGRSLGRSTGATLQYAFEDAGRHAVSVTVSDGIGGTTTANRTVSVGEASGADIDVDVDPRVHGRALEGVSFRNRYRATVEGSSDVCQVSFDLEGRHEVDADGSDGWSATFDLGELEGDAELTARAVGSGGATGTETVAVRVDDPPAWVDAFRALGTVRVDRRTGRIEMESQIPRHPGRHLRFAAGDLGLELDGQLDYVLVYRMPTGSGRLDHGTQAEGKVAVPVPVVGGRTIPMEFGLGGAYDVNGTLDTAPTWNIRNGTLGVQSSASVAFVPSVSPPTGATGSNPMLALFEPSVGAKAGLEFTGREEYHLDNRSLERVPEELRDGEPPGRGEHPLNVSGVNTTETDVGMKAGAPLGLSAGFTQATVTGELLLETAISGEGVRNESYHVDEEFRDPPSFRWPPDESRWSADGPPITVNESQLDDWGYSQKASVRGTVAWNWAECSLSSAAKTLRRDGVDSLVDVFAHGCSTEGDLVTLNVLHVNGGADILPVRGNDPILSGATYDDFSAVNSGNPSYTYAWEPGQDPPGSIPPDGHDAGAGPSVASARGGAALAADSSVTSPSSDGGSATVELARDAAPSPGSAGERPPETPGDRLLTSNDLDDEHPAVAAGDDGYTVVWSGQRPNVSDRFGRDLFVREYAPDEGWTDRRALTEDALFDREPAVARGPNGSAAVAWTRLNSSADVASLADFRNHTEVAYATRTNGTWSRPEPLTSNGLYDGAPTIVHRDGTWTVAWEQASTPPSGATNDGAAPDGRVVVATLAVDGTVLANATVPSADRPALAAGDASTRLAVSSTNGTVDVLTASNGSVERAASFETAGVDGLDAAGDAVAWLERGPNGTRPVVASNGTARPVSVGAGSYGLRDVRVATGGERTLLAYRARGLGADGRGSGLVYQRRTGSSGGWTAPRTVRASTNASRQLRDPSVASTGRGFLSAATGSRLTGAPDDEVLVADHRYRPDLAISLPDGERRRLAGASPGSEVAANVTVRNVGDEPLAAPATVRAESGRHESSASIDGLAAGEATDETIEVAVGRTGLLDLSVAPGAGGSGRNGTNASVAELGTENNRATVVVERPDTAVTSVDRVRRGDEVVATATVRNRGNATVRDATASLRVGNRSRRVAVGPIAPGERTDASFEVPLDGLEEGAVARFASRARSPVPERERDVLGLTVPLLRPDLRVDAAGASVTDSGNEVRVNVTYSNGGTGRSSGDLLVRSNGTTLVDRSLDVGPRSNGSATTATASLVVDAAAVGDGATVDLRDRSDARPYDNLARVEVDPGAGSSPDDGEQTNGSGGDGGSGADGSDGGGGGLVLPPDGDGSSTGDGGSTESSFAVRGLVVSDRTPAVGDEVVATATVANVGDAAGTFDALLESGDGATLARRSVGIDPDSERTVELSVRVERPGDRRLEVGNASETLTVRATGSAPGPGNRTGSTGDGVRGQGGEDADEAGDGLPGFGVGAALVALVALLALAGRRAGREES